MDTIRNNGVDQIFQICVNNIGFERENTEPSGSRAGRTVAELSDNLRPLGIPVLREHSENLTELFTSQDPRGANDQ